MQSVLATLLLAALAACANHAHAMTGNYDATYASQLTQLQKLLPLPIPLTVRAPKDNRTQCRQDILRYYGALIEGQLPALQMLDSMGKIPSGLLNANWLSPGSFSECMFANISIVRKDDSSFTSEYCLSYLRPKVTGIEFRVGICVPETCNNDEAKSVMVDILNDAAKDASKAGNKILAETLSSMNVTRAQCQRKNLTMTTWGICAVCLIGFVAALVLFGTGYDLYLLYWQTLCEYWHAIRHIHSVTYQLPLDERVSVASIYTNGMEVRESVISLQSTVHVPDAEKVSMDTMSRNGNGTLGASRSNSAAAIYFNTQRNTVAQPQSVVERLLLCFSLRINVAKLLNTTPPKTNSGEDQISCAHGMRALSMSWVVLGHTIYEVAFLTFNPLNTITQITMYVNNITFMAILSGILSVDSFFAMSGLLTSYLGLKQLHKIGGPRKMNWGLFYVHRYLRLTPVYAIALITINPLFRHLYFGPLWPQQEVLEPACATNWWTNMLYINNVVNTNQMCMGHTWYLANDMQFYIISPLILIPWFYSAIAGFVLSGALVVTSITSTAVIAVNRNYSANMLNAGGLPPDGGFYRGSFVDIYIAPYCRVGAYAVGLMAGYVMYRLSLIPKQRKEKFMSVHRGRLILANILGWAIAAFLCLGTVYGPFDMQRGATVWSTSMHAFYLSTSHVAWSVGVCYVIVACASGYGGWVNGLLSWRFFVPLSRLTYCAYLVHWYVVWFIYAASEQPIEMSVIYYIYYFLGHVVLAYAVGFVFSMLFEAPFMSLEKIIFSGQAKIFTNNNAQSKDKALN